MPNARRHRPAQRKSDRPQEDDQPQACNREKNHADPSLSSRVRPYSRRTRHRLGALQITGVCGRNLFDGPAT